jgi:hypothetical protein
MPSARRSDTTFAGPAGRVSTGLWLGGSLSNAKRQPAPAKSDPEPTVLSLKPRAVLGSREHPQLLTKLQVLEDQVGAGPA